MAGRAANFGVVRREIDPSLLFPPHSPVRLLLLAAGGDVRSSSVAALTATGESLIFFLSTRDPVLSPSLPDFASSLCCLVHFHPSITSNCAPTTSAPSPPLGIERQSYRLRTVERSDAQGIVEAGVKREPGLDGAIRTGICAIQLDSLLEPTWQTSSMSSSAGSRDSNETAPKCSTQWQEA